MSNNQLNSFGQPTLHILVPNPMMEEGWRPIAAQPELTMLALPNSLRRPKRRAFQWHSANYKRKVISFKEELETVLLQPGAHSSTNLMEEFVILRSQLIYKLKDFACQLDKIQAHNKKQSQENSNLLRRNRRLRQKLNQQSDHLYTSNKNVKTDVNLDDVNFPKSYYTPWEEIDIKPEDFDISADIEKLNSLH